MIVTMSTDRKMTLGGAARVADTLSEGVKLIDKDVTAIRVLIDHAHATGLTAPRVLVVGEDYRASGTAWAAADLVVDQTGRVLKWRYGPVPEVTR